MTPSSLMAMTGRAARWFCQPASLDACRMRSTPRVLTLRRLAIVRPAELMPRACRHATAAARLEQV